MRSLPKLSMKVDFPAPGSPVMPMRTDFPVYGIILFSKSSACSRCSAFRLSTSVMALPSIRLLPDLIPFISSSLEIFIFSNVQKTIFRLQKYLYFRAQIFTNEKRNAYSDRFRYLYGFLFTERNGRTSRKQGFRICPDCTGKSNFRLFLRKMP